MDIEDEIREIAQAEAKKAQKEVVFPDIQKVEVTNFPEQKEPIINVTVDSPKIPEIQVPTPIVNVESPTVNVEKPDLSELANGLKELSEKFSQFANKEYPAFNYQEFERIAKENKSVYQGGAVGPSKLFIRDKSGLVVNPGEIYAKDSASVDAFGRWRVSNPETLFDSKNIFDDADIANTAEQQALLYDNAETSGGGTATAYNANKSSQSLSVSATTAGTRIRQSKMRFNYQPGKSQLVLMTFNLDGTASGITKREGLFDDNNGILLEASGTTINLVRRTKTSGSVANNKVAQSSWNLDTMDGTGASKINLDWTKTQILLIDFEWLGVGRVRVGFVVDGMIYYAHEFLNANSLDVVYMSTPNLPLRSEISNDGTGVAATITQICSSVISEGGSQDLGITRYKSTAGTHLDADTENSVYALLGIKLKAAYLGATIKVLSAAIQVHTNSKIEWMLLLNPTVAGTGGDAFTYSNLANSAVQTAVGKTANTVTGGTEITGGYVESGAPGIAAGGSGTSSIDSALRLGSKIDGTADTLVLCVRPIAGSTSVDVEGSLTWRELL